MKKIAIYGGTELSAPESWFVVSLTQALLACGDVIIVTGGFLYWPDKVPGAISTDFSVLQGVTKFCLENGKSLKDCLETWLPDTEAETDPHKKGVIRFKEGKVKNLTGESAQARRYSMVRDVDVLITVSGKKHTAMVLDFALSINKPALPLAFTGGDSEIFWNNQKKRVKDWFGLTDEFAVAMGKKKMEEWTPVEKDTLLKEIVAAVDKAFLIETSNQRDYKKQLQKMDAEDNESVKDLIPRSQTGDNGGLSSAPSQKQLSLFFSYSHKDDALRDELDKHLTALKRSGKISVWHDKEIEGGSEWNKTIKEELKSADIVLLLVSPDFVQSKYINEVELQYALQKHENGQAKVIPIFLRSVDIEDMPFEKLQGYISPEKPIASLPVDERDDAFYRVVKSIRGDIKGWLAEM